MVNRWSMGNAAAAAEAEADSGASAGWLAFVVILGGVVGAAFVSELGHRRSTRRPGSSSLAAGSAARVQLRPLGGTTSGTGSGIE